MYAVKIKVRVYKLFQILSVSDAFLKRLPFPLVHWIQKKLSFCTQIFMKMKSNGQNRLTPEVERAY